MPFCGRQPIETQHAWNVWMLQKRVFLDQHSASHTKVEKKWVDTEGNLWKNNKLSNDISMIYVNFFRKIILEHLGTDGRIISKWILREWGWKVTGCMWPAQILVVGCCERSNGPSGSIMYGEFLDWVTTTFSRMTPCWLVGCRRAYWCAFVLVFCFIIQPVNLLVWRSKFKNDCDTKLLFSWSEHIEYQNVCLVVSVMVNGWRKFYWHGCEVWLVCQ